jgi:ribonuclease HI
MDKIVIYTDGACAGNPGVGGWAAVVIRIGCDDILEFSGGFFLTTNNRMELMAAIVALESLEVPSDVTLHSDSKYLVNTMSEGWARNANCDLWERLYAVAAAHSIRWVWVRGHSGDSLNERCDELAAAESVKGDHPPDDGYMHVVGFGRDVTGYESEMGYIHSCSR